MQESDRDFRQAGTHRQRQLERAQEEGGIRDHREGFGGRESPLFPLRCLLRAAGERVKEKESQDIIIRFLLCGSFPALLHFYQIRT